MRGSGKSQHKLNVFKFNAESTITGPNIVVKILLTLLETKLQYQPNHPVALCLYNHKLCHKAYLLYVAVYLVTKKII